MRAPNFTKDLVGKTFDGKEILRVVSMDEESDEVLVLIDDRNINSEYKIILSLAKTLNLLGYFKDEIKTVIEEKKDVKIIKQFVVKDEEGDLE